MWVKPERARHELKYTLDLATAGEFLRRASAHCVPDPHAGPGGVYEVASLYYDTSDLRFYWDRQESVGQRRKVRLRSYNSGGESAGVFLEIKEKHRSLVAKKRVGLTNLDSLIMPARHDKTPLDSVLAAIGSEAIGRAMGVAAEVSYLHTKLGLLPVSIIRYVRSTLTGVAERDLRITFDERITTGGADLFSYCGSREVFVHPSGQGILEVKADQQLPLWLGSLLSEFALVQTRFSKYCLAVDALFGVRPGVISESKEQIESGEEMQAQGKSVLFG